MDQNLQTDQQLEPLIQAFFGLNPHPADAQIHALAAAVGVDKETLEAVIYRMFGEQSQVAPAAQAPAAAPVASAIRAWAIKKAGSRRGNPLNLHAATMSERILQDEVSPELIPTDMATIVDGLGSAAKDQMIQDITYVDGAPVIPEAE